MSCLAAEKRSKHIALPHHDEKYWKGLRTIMLDVAEWSPLVLVQTIQRICELDADKPFKNPPEKRYSVLLKLFSESEEFEGSPAELWGGLTFDSFQQENFPQIVYWFCAHTLPLVKQLLLSMPELFKTKIPLSNQENRDPIILSKQQCAALLAVAFFCANPSAHAPIPHNDYQGVVNFSSWVESPSYCNKAKLLMLMNYFERTRLQIKEQNFEIHRLKLRSPLSLSSWVKRTDILLEFAVHDTGGITETCGNDVLHVDFANQYIGGGVLHMGAVQEEIMFSVAPELLVSLFFCSVMRDDEALVLVNAEKYSKHTGYNTGLKFAGDFVDVSGTCRVAIDATCFGWGLGSDEQWKQESVMRELNKAFVGFDHVFPTAGAGIATGNWGCGAFGGNIQLKSMLQWCAGSAAGRPLLYFTFKDRNCKGLAEVVALIKEHSWTVGKLIQTILCYCEEKTSGKAQSDLFTFIKHTIEH